MAKFHTISVVNKHHGAIGEYIGRGSALGNPYPITKTASRNQVIDQYGTWLQLMIQRGEHSVIRQLDKLAEIAMSKPLNLVCFCAPQRCHGDVIKRVLCEAISNHQE